MKKVYYWLRSDLKSIGAVQIILIILIVPLYIIFLGDYLNSQAINILIALAAIVSTCFLYLAFRESRKANELKRNEPLFENFKNEIAQLEAQSRECIFNEDALQLLSDRIKFKVDFLKMFTFGRFLLPFERLFTLLNSNENYKFILKSIGKSQQVGINNGISQDMGSALNQIYIAIIRLSSYYSKTHFLYSSIDRSEIDTKHKILLFEKLNVLDSDFRRLNKYFSEDSEELKILKNFRWFDYEYGSNTFTIVPMNEWILINSMYGRTQEFLEKYKERTGIH
jgi:hypothetical protein